MNNSQPLSLAQVVAELQKISHDKLSGNMTIVAENRQMIRIGLISGNIVTLSYKNKRGAEALSLMQQIKPDWFQFIKSSSVTPDPDWQPSTTEIFNFLSGGSISSLKSGPIKTAAKALSQQTLEVLKEVLTEFMGPVAPAICNKVLRQDLNLDMSIDLLAKEIPEWKESLQFKEQVRQKLLTDQSLATTA